MKRFIALFLALLLPLIAAGCGGAASAESADAPESSSEASFQPEASGTSAAAVNTASIGDITMDYIKFGTGEKTFVILPGLSVHSVTGSADAIANAYSKLCDDYTVYLFDRRADVPADYTIRDMANDTADIMASLGIDKADVFGVSQGGMIAQYLAIDHPGTVNKLILGSTLSRPNATAAAAVGKWIELASAHDETGLLESFVDTVYSSDTLAAYRDVLMESNRGITDEEYDRFVIIASACLDFNCYDELSSITCPTFVIGSEGDRVVTADASREIADALGCEVYIYPDTYGHGVYDEAPDYLDRCIEFLNK